MANSGGLRTIFSFFLALMVAAFVGVGVYTFHGPPRDLEEQLQELNRRDVSLRVTGPEHQLTEEESAELEELRAERDELQDRAEDARERWGRSTSIILTTLATLIMVVSLVRADQLPVLSNGLLLGGLFTMLYGVGWIIATDSSIVRFLVMTVALAITIGLGYVRFVRQRGQAAAAGAPPGDVTDLERRLGDLERRMDDAASALRSGRDSR